jgi:MerR family transcriptional regulator, mercuric resistance operon regulatory protein
MMQKKGVPMSRPKIADRHHGRIAIGELAARTGLSIETIRYYEKIGLVLRPARTQTARRVYDPSEVRRFAFIRRARELGFSLSQVRGLISLAERRDNCDDVLALARAHLADIGQRIRDLRRIERTLRKASHGCAPNTAACPIIDEMFGAASRPFLQNRNRRIRPETKSSLARNALAGTTGS